MKYPELKIIDSAIAFLQRGVDVYSCAALSTAVWNAKWGKSYQAYLRLYRRYQRQYERFTVQDRGGRYPQWWSKTGNTLLQKTHYRNARIRALKRFRKACIDAAKKEQV